MGFRERKEPVPKCHYSSVLSGIDEFCFGPKNQKFYGGNHDPERWPGPGLPMTASLRHTCLPKYLLSFSKLKSKVEPGASRDLVLSSKTHSAKSDEPWGCRIEAAAWVSGGSWLSEHRTFTIDFQQKQMKVSVLTVVLYIDLHWKHHQWFVMGNLRSIKV